MSLTTIRRVTVFTEISAIVSVMLANLLAGPAPAAFASPEQPVVAYSIPAPTGVTIDSPWVTDATSLTAWALGTSSSGTGVLARRDLATGTITTTPTVAGEVGATEARLHPGSGTIAFLAKRAGLGGRIVIINPTTGARISSYDLAATDTAPRGLGFHPMGVSLYFGSNPGTSVVTKVTTSTGVLSSSANQAQSPTTSGIMYGSKFVTTAGTSAPRLVGFKDGPPIQVDTSTALTGITQALVDPVLVGTVGWYGTDTAPGRLVGIDFPTRTVVANFSLASDETGLRNITVPSGSGFAYGTTVSNGRTKLVTIRLTDGARLGSVDLGGIVGATSITVNGRYVDVTFAGSTAVIRTTTSTAPASPANLTVTESDRSLTAEWTASVSAEPLVTYTATANGGGQQFSCTTSEVRCSFDGLDNGVEYDIDVTASTYAGTSPAVTTTASPATLPAAPSRLIAERGDGEVIVSWDTPDDGGRPITGYTAVLEPGGQECQSTAARCTFAGLSNGTAYTATVVAHTSWGASTPSGASAPVTPATTPSTPSGIAVTAQIGGAGLEWQVPDNGGEAISGYRVTVWDEAVVAQDLTVASPTASLTGLAFPSTYRVTIEAINAVGASERAVVWVSPLAPPPPPVVEPPVVEPPVIEPPVVEPPIVEPPAPPTITTPASPRSVRLMFATSKGYTLTWSRPADGGAPISDYRIGKRLSGSTRYTDVKDGVSARRTVFIPRPKSGKTVYVRLVSVNSAGQSNPATIVAIRGKKLYEMPRVVAVRFSDAAAFAGLDARSTR